MNHTVTAVAQPLLSSLDEEILAAIALRSGAPPTALQIAQRCPSAHETHAVSLRLQVLKRAGLILASGDGRRTRYRLAAQVRPKSASIARLGRREDPFGEDLTPDTTRVRRDILVALERAGHPLSKEELVPLVPSARSRHELSQQIHVLLTRGHLETTATKPRLYWRTTSQLELDLTGTEEPFKPQLRRLRHGWALRLQPGRSATITPLAPGITVAKAGATVIGIVIDDALIGGAS